MRYMDIFASGLFPYVLPRLFGNNDSQISLNLRDQRAAAPIKSLSNRTKDTVSDCTVASPKWRRCVFSRINHH